MSLIPVGANTIGYKSISLTLGPTGNSQILSTRNLKFGITGANYLGQTGGSTSYIGTSGSTAMLYIRNLNGIGGTTAGDIVILTNDIGNGSASFTINKGPVYDLSLLYSTNNQAYNAFDYTTPVHLTLPTFQTYPGGIFSVGDQVVRSSGITGIATLTNVYYDGITATGRIEVYKPLSNIGVSGVSGGLTGILIGSGILSNGTIPSLSLVHGATFDTNVGDYYMLHYYLGSSGISGGYSYNYVGLTGINLPFGSNIQYNTSSAGVTATFIQPLYNNKGLTAGNSVMITDFQDGITAILPVQLSSKNYPYATYFFGSTGISGSSGTTATVLSGSSLKYYNGTKASNNSYSIPAHTTANEYILGSMDSYPPIATNSKITAKLSNFDYVDVDGNSIFKNFYGGDTGILYIISQYDGCTAGLYSGPTSLTGSTGIVIAPPYPSSYNIEFVTGISDAPVTRKYTASFYDSTSGMLKGATANFTLTSSRSASATETILGTFTPHTNSTNTLINISNFDYLDVYGQSILAGASGHTGYIELLGGVSGPMLKGTTYASYNPNGTYTILYPGTFVANVPQYFYIGFYDTSGPTAQLRSSTKVIRAMAIPDQMISAIEDVQRDPSLVVTSFDYLDGSGQSIFRTPGITGATGYLELFDPAGTMLQRLPTRLDINTKYNFNIPMPPGSSGFHPFVGYYLKFFNSTLNTLMPAFTAIESGITGFSDPNAGGTASDWTGGYTGPTSAFPANFIFPYEFQASAPDIIQITLLGELDFGPSGGALETIRMSVPYNELQRMFVYDSGWANGMTGLGAAGLSGLSGSTSQTSMYGGQGATGPNVGLLLQYVLSNLNVRSGYTGIAGGYNQSNRLMGLDTLFSTKTATYPQDGNGGTGDAWNTLSYGGPTGGPAGILGYPSSLTGGYFVDDAGITCAQLGVILNQNLTNTNYTYSSSSLLNSIPIEAVKTVNRLGFQIPTYSGQTGIFKDIDTTMSTYRPALQNLFEQAVAFNRISDSQTTPVSSIGILSSGIGPWLTNSTIYKVDFAIGDTLSLYVNYQFGQVRQYGIDPTVVAGLGPQFQSAPVYSLTFAGRTFNIPIGQQDSVQSAYQSSYNMGTPQNLSYENSLQNSSQTIEIRLVATDPSLKSVFDY